MTPLRLAILGCFGVAVALVLVLHVVSDLDPVERRLSEYAVGDQAALMTVAFFLVGLGLALLGILIAGADGRAWTGCGLLLVVAGAGMVVSGIYPTDPGASTAAEAIHSRASAAATILIVAASLWWSFGAPSATRVQRILATIGALLVPLSVALHETSLSGLGQRLLWLTLVSWCVVVSVPLGGDRARRGPYA